MSKFLRPLMAVALPAAIALSVACSSSNKTPNDPNRSVANVETDAADEDNVKAFETLMNDQMPQVQLKTTYLERLLRIYYRAELYVEEFESNLDRILAKQKTVKGDGSTKEELDPLNHVSYRKLIGQRMLSDRLVERIEFVYKRLLETSKSGATEEMKARAVQVLTEMNNWVSGLAEEDKLQLVDLFRRLDEVKNSFDTAQAYGQPGRGIAAASDISTYAWMDSRDLESRHKKLRKKTRKKAADTKTWRDAESDGEFADLKLERTERMPAAAKIYPSAGPDGNVIGKAFPKGVFVMTYDDGPGGRSTPRLLSYLKAAGVPASFFSLVKQVKALPGVVAQQKAQFPNNLNNHSWTHANFAKSSQAQLNHEIIESTDALKAAYGKSFQFFRCPYGACFAPKIPRAREMIAQQGLIHAYWTVDSLDWKNIGQPGRTLELIKKQMAANGRGIILMHDIHESSVDASKMLFDYARQAGGIKFKDLETAVADYNRQ